MPAAVITLKRQKTSHGMDTQFFRAAHPIFRDELNPQPKNWRSAWKYTNSGTKQETATHTDTQALKRVRVSSFQESFTVTDRWVTVSWAAIGVGIWVATTTAIVLGIFGGIHAEDLLPPVAVPFIGYVPLILFAVTGLIAAWASEPDRGKKIRWGVGVATAAACPGTWVTVLVSTFYCLKILAL